MKKVFISFDYEKNRSYKDLLVAWSNNKRFKFTFDDRTPKEIMSDSVVAVKRVLSWKISEASVVLVIVGEDINKLHKDHEEIGYRNWQNYEIAKANELKKPIIVVRIDPKYELPTELEEYASLINGFKVQPIDSAINESTNL